MTKPSSVSITEGRVVCLSKEAAARKAHSMLSCLCRWIEANEKNVAITKGGTLHIDLIDARDELMASFKLDRPRRLPPHD